MLGFMFNRITTVSGLRSSDRCAFRDLFACFFVCLDFKKPENILQEAVTVGMQCQRPKIMFKLSLWNFSDTRTSWKLVQAENLISEVFCVFILIAENLFFWLTNPFRLIVLPCLKKKDCWALICKNRAGKMASTVQNFEVASKLLISFMPGFMERTLVETPLDMRNDLT